MLLSMPDRSAARLERKRDRARAGGLCVVCCRGVPAPERAVCHDCNEAAKRRVAVGRRKRAASAQAQAQAHESSLQRTVAHLLKHLREPYALQRNPFARDYIADARPLRASGAWGAKELAALRAHVLEAAAACRRASLQQQRDEQAHRQYTVVVRHYVEGHSIEAVAAELCISVRQCYRERRAATRLLAAYFGQQNSTPHAGPVVVYDTFVAHMDRVALLSEVGQHADAIANLEDIARAAREPARRIHALCAQAEILTRNGHWKAAKTCVLAAERSLRDDDGDVATAGSSRRRIDFEKTKLRWETDGISKSPTLLEIAADADRVSLAGDPYAADLGVDVLMAAAYFLEAYGEPDRAYDHLKRAQRVAALSENPWRKCEVSIAQSRLERLRATASCQFRSTDSALRRNNDILRTARRSGSPRTVVHSLINLMQEALFLGNGDAVVSIGTLAQELAGKLNSPHFCALTSALVADSIVQTEHFASFSAIGAGIDVEALGGTGWVAFELARIAYYLRCGQHREAWQCAKLLEEQVRLPRKSRSRGVLACRLATTSFALGRTSEAKQYIQPALESAVRYNTAFMQMEAFQVAAGILSDARFSRRAAEIRRGLHENAVPVGAWGVESELLCQP
jgi:tetratricopeptide (TPR) repeat protein